MTARRNGEDIIDLGMETRPADAAAYYRQTGRGVAKRISIIVTSRRRKEFLSSAWQSAIGIRENITSSLILKPKPSRRSAQRKDCLISRLPSPVPATLYYVPSPAYPIHPYAFIIAGAQVIHIPMEPFDQSSKGSFIVHANVAEPEIFAAELPEQSYNGNRRPFVL